MKKVLVVVLILLGYFPILGQNPQPKDTLCTDFESYAPFIKGIYGSWQIGKPNKQVFDVSYSPTQSIVTDTVNVYPISDSSVFYANYTPPWVQNYLGSYNPFEIEFWHRFDMDSLQDFGLVEVSVDGGNQWFDVFGTLYNSMPYDSANTNIHIFEGIGDTVLGRMKITGNSGGWVHSKVVKDISYCNNQSGWGQIDSIMVRFTFKSDTIQTSKGGWQIDDLCIRYYLGILSVQEGVENKPIIVSPNPFSTETIFESNELLKDVTINIYNVLGQIQKQLKNVYGYEWTFNREGLTAGLYFFEVIENDRVILKDKFIVIDP